MMGPTMFSLSATSQASLSSAADHSEVPTCTQLVPVSKTVFSEAIRRTPVVDQSLVNQIVESADDLLHGNT